MVQNSILKTKLNTSDTNIYKSIIKNPANQIFNAPLMGDYELYDASLARDKGDIAVGNLFPLDLNEQSRTMDAAPDLGAYEFE